MTTMRDLNSTDWNMFYPRFDIILPAVYVFITIAGVIGNGFVLMILLRSTKNRCIPDVFIINLAVADLLFVLTLPFFAYVYAAGSWIFGRILCKVIVGFDGMNQFTGILILTAMSIDRYFVIARPIRSKAYRTISKARVTSVLVWVTSFLCSLPLWTYAELNTEPNGVIVCQVMWPNPQANALSFLLFAFIVGFVLPVTAILTFYWAILNHVFERKSKQIYDNSRARSAQCRYQRVVNLVRAVVCAFIICWLPFYIMNFITLTVPDTDKGSGTLNKALVTLYITSICLSYFNSCLNPIIYSFLGSSFRLRLKRIVRRRRSLQNETRITNSFGSSRNRQQCQQIDSTYN
ncbi:somatostatin receptor type 3-like [Saccoglossus kowalevskii]|uniref:Somatostatin receptor type 3-like n=1 Tax=Saccoglossus kowalevskii TaxID=10224 RepID=A0ABM0MD68_SACKO|nr:PREDICTED: somatostatin receptor type 3-like [Saccoglossus kowalevskii]